MKQLLRPGLLAILAGLGLATVAQAQQWEWVGGSSTFTGDAGVYGKLGKASAGNSIGGRIGAVGWADKSGNIWYFGGYGYDDGSNGEGDLNDLWKFNPTTSQWTWMKGNSWAWQNGTYGTKGTASSANTPGARYSPAAWTDKSGNFWLFGGQGDDADSNWGQLNDLWEFYPATNKWTWVGGSDTIGANAAGTWYGVAGVYGTKGVFAAKNIPGSRDEATTWTDAKGNLWMFGGFGYYSTGNLGYFNDLWEFNSTSKQWAWIAGSSSVPSNGLGAAGVYGTKGKAAAANTPGSRSYANSWVDSSGNLWLFGGWGFDAKGLAGYMNDLWEFSASAKQWTWVSGSNSIGTVSDGPYGVYGTKGKAAASNVPGGRYASVSWTDTKGNFWLSGGVGYAQNINWGELNDLWAFSPVTKQWSWEGGSNTLVMTTDGEYGQLGVYGKLKVSAAANMPGGRESATSVTDKSGNFWLIGGAGIDGSGNYGYLNDLWEVPMIPVP